ncbi:Rpn family recombination-promoting nuclease/putative transposase [Pantoea sp. KPR_PJ]|uniref:Rpn family recombination-promoting nuclease/putative transposase n=1 Tax=Pantoea sp. KPR_PJ TaxID=2738375 RepID=UPI003526CB2C
MKNGSEKSITPHDALFKTFLAHTHMARNFVEQPLPDGLLRICGLATLRLTSGSLKEELMTIAEQLKQTGREEDRQQRLAQGVKKGQREATLAIARNMLARSIDVSLMQGITGLSAADLQQVHHESQC